MKRFLLLNALTLIAAAAMLPTAAAQLTVQFDPNTIDFGEVAVGSSSTEMTSVSIQGASALALEALSTNPAFVVEPIIFTAVSGQPRTLNVTFNPNVAGLITGNIELRAANMIGLGEEGKSQQNPVLAVLPVRGVGTARFEVTPAMLDFPPTLVGQSSAAMAVRVRNLDLQMGQTIRITSPIPEFSVTPDEVMLMPGGSATVSVTFSPSRSAAVRSAVIFDSLDESSLSVVVTGSGIAFTVAPNPLLLPDTLIGCASEAELLVTPAGTVDILAGAANQGVFVVTPRVIQGDMRATLTVRAPGVPGGGRESEVILTNRERGVPVQQEFVPVAVNAVGVVATPELLDFGTVPVGAEPAVRAIEVTTDPLSMVDFELSALSDSVDFIVDSIEGNIVNIRFGPQAAGQFSGVISITASPMIDPMCVREIRIPVSGQAGEDQITLDPPVLAFGPVGVGAEATRSVTLANSSRNAFTGTVDIDSDVFSIGPGVGQTAFNLPAGGSTTFDVTFRPRTLGAVSTEALFLLNSNSGSLRLTRSLPITGEGADVQLTYEVFSEETLTPLSPGGTFSAARTPVGAASVFDLRIVNGGGAPITVNSASLEGAAFRELTPPTFPATIAAGGTLPIIYEFRPTVVGTARASIAIDDALFSVVGVGTAGGAQITGVVPAIDAASQLDVGVRLDEALDQAVTGVVQLDYQPRGGLPPDPAVQFATGTTASFTIPAGATLADFGGAETVGLQSGTVAADLNLTANLDAGGADVTPVTGLSTSGAIAEAAPTIVSVAFADVSGSGFTIVVTGYSPTRQVNAATFNFQARSGVQITNTTVSPGTIGGAFASWFDGSTEFGGLFTLRMPFTISGEQNAVSGVSVTLQNDAGTSASVSASR